VTSTVTEYERPEAGKAAGAGGRLRTLIRGGGLVVAAQAAITGGSFIRNLIVARFVTKADFGVASLIAMWLSLGELFGDMGVGRCLVRSPEKDQGGFLGTAHVLTFALFTTTALVLIGGGGVAAEVMHKAEYAWAFRAVGLILWIRSFTHCGSWQVQRSMRFGPMAIAQAVSQGAGILMAVPAALLLKDYRAMVLLAGVNVLAFVAMTHVVSPQKYQWKYVGRFASSFWSFGAPLVADGLLMFLLFNGERIIISRTQSDQVLGAYSAVYQLAFAPTVLLANVALGLGIPELAHAPDDAARNRRYAVACGLIGVCVIGVAFVMIMGGGPLMKIVFGSKYAGSWPILAAVALGQGFRILRIAPTVRAMERGDTLLPFVCNLLRAASLIPSWLIAQQGAEVWKVLGVGVVGEALAAFACTLGVEWRWKAPSLANLLWMGAYILAACVCVLVPRSTGSEDRMILLPIGIGAGAAAGAVGLALVPGLRRELHRLKRLWPLRRGAASGEPTP
jgi:O-antigen/teichoic acid export membrane protein